MEHTTNRSRGVKFQQRYEKRHGRLAKPFCAKELSLRGTPKSGHPSSNPFWGLDSRYPSDEPSEVVRRLVWR